MQGTDEAFCRCKEDQLATVTSGDYSGHGEAHIIAGTSIFYVNGVDRGTTVPGADTHGEVAMLAFDSPCNFDQADAIRAPTGECKQSHTTM